MRGMFKLNWHKHCISLRIFHPTSIKINISISMHLNSHTCNKITLTTSRISTCHSNHTRKEGVVETSEEEVEEEYLVEEDAKLHAITVDNWVTMPEIA